MPEIENLRNEDIIELIESQIETEGAVSLRSVANKLQARLGGYIGSFIDYVSFFKPKLSNLGYQVTTIGEALKDESGRKVIYEGGRSAKGAVIIFNDRDRLEDYVIANSSREEIIKIDVSKILNTK